MSSRKIVIKGASEHNLKSLDLTIDRDQITVVTGVSGSGKSSLAFDTLLAESQRRFFYTLSNYTRQFLDLGSRPKVKLISGLSPAISLAQNETQPSRRASVATLSELGELLGIIYARYSEKMCPDHMLPTSSQTQESICERILNDYAGQTISICAPVVEKKKGNFRTRLAKYSQRGFMKAFIDGEVVNLSPVPELVKEEKHTIKLIIDYIKVSQKSAKRLSRSMATALAESEQYFEVFTTEGKGELVLESKRTFSLRSGCPECGYAWPPLDTRYFSANSLGQCSECEGFGSIGVNDDDDAAELSDLEKQVYLCEACDGTGLAGRLRAIQVEGKSVVDLHKMSVCELRRLVQAWADQPKHKTNPAFMRVQEELVDHLERIGVVGLDYIQLYRRIRSLSGGESQRLKLAGILGENLRGVMYVLDEPSQGLHPSEIETLCQTLQKLRDYGNTILIVDHDEIVMRHADRIIDLGPTGGTEGGHVMASFPPAHAREFKSQSRTAEILAKRSTNLPFFASKNPNHGFFEMINPKIHNLDIKRVKFAKSSLNVVSGVSGSGKSSLALSLLYENVAGYVAQQKARGKRRKKFSFQFVDEIAGVEEFDNVWLIDRKPVAKSTVSMPATYLDIFTDLRKLYESVPEAQISGLTARSFSLQLEGGRCDECRGRGQVVLSMRFLSDARVQCPSCEGRRYQGAVLGVRYKGLNLSEVLDLTIEEAVEHFATHRRIVRKLQPAMKLGLGYLKLGQQSASLSGGEAQRLKLVPFLTKQQGSSTLLVVDEPTTGLHARDTAKLIQAVRDLVSAGTTVVMIEHNMDVVRNADWVVDLGPGAAENGGKVIYAGLPSKLVDCKQSVTARYL